MKNSKKNLKNIYLVAVLGSTIGLGTVGCVNRQAQAQSAATEKYVKDTTLSVVVQPAKLQSMNSNLGVTGSLTAADDSLIGSKAAGKIIAVYVKDGDKVSSGQLIAEMDTAQLSAQLNQARGQEYAAEATLSQAVANEKYQPQKSNSSVRQAKAQLASAQASLQKLINGSRPEERKQAEAVLASAKVNLATANADLRRKQELVDQGALAANTLDASKASQATAEQAYENALQNVLIIKNGSRPEDIMVARQQVQVARDQLSAAESTKSLDVTYGDSVEAARAQLESARAQVQLAVANLQDARIKAPFSGVISGRPVQPGTVVSAGTQIVRLISTSGTYFDAQVTETAVPQIKIGMSAAISVDALPGEQFAGHVAGINPLGGNIGRLFSVRIVIDNPNPELRSNMFAKAVIKTSQSKNAVVVPQNAIVSNGDSNYVFTVNGGVAKRLQVQEGLQNGNDVQVTGISAGTPIVIQGQELLDDGSKVKVITPPAGSLS